MNPGALKKVTITKARFGEIIGGMQYGGVYSFYKKAYNRFYPLAKKAGMNLGREDFSSQTPTDLHFVRVEKMSVSTN